MLWRRVIISFSPPRGILLVGGLYPTSSLVHPTGEYIHVPEQTARNRRGRLHNIVFHCRRLTRGETISRLGIVLVRDSPAARRINMRRG